ncbi:DsbA family protein [Amycolatopsis arida]|nr:thioredoxin domain-containing protein [Amycolatopsis arida]
MPKTKNPLTKKSSVSTNVILTVIVLVVAVVVIGGVLLANRDGGSAEGVSSEVLRPEGSHTLTTADTGVYLVEFLDYQCPACAGYYKNVTKQLEQDYAGRITFVTRNFPLDMHPLAMLGASAAEAAALQGKYQEMYHALFDNWNDWAVAPDGQGLGDDEQRARAAFDRFAQQIGLDLEKFHADMESPAVRLRIEAGKADGNKAGVKGTPTLFVNGQKFEPTAQDYAGVDRQLRERIDEALAR